MMDIMNPCPSSNLFKIKSNCSLSPDGKGQHRLIAKNCLQPNSELPSRIGSRKRSAETEMCFSPVTRSNLATRSKVDFQLIAREPTEVCSILPGLPDDVAKVCLALVPRSYFPVMGTVSKRWRSFIQGKEFIIIRKEVGKLEEWLYVLTGDTKGKGSHWEVLGNLEDKRQVLPLMPGPAMAGFGVVVLDGKLLVMAGYSVDEGTHCVSADVYQYDSRLNRWDTLAKMNIARYDFACAEVDGLIYVVGGHASSGVSLSSTEAYGPDTNKWTLIECIRRPRWGCFGCSFEGKLYVMSGRSNFTMQGSEMSFFCLQLDASSATKSADPRGHWQACKLNHANCNAGQIQFLQRFRNQMLNAVKGFSMSSKNGLFTSSCFSQCQLEKPDTSVIEPVPTGKLSRRLARSGTANPLTPRAMQHGDLVEEVHGCPGRSGEVGLGAGCAPSSRGNVAAPVELSASAVMEVQQQCRAKSLMGSLESLHCKPGRAVEATGLGFCGSCF